MMNPFVLQFLAALLFAMAMVKDKQNLRRFKLPPADYTFMVFVWLVVVAAVVTPFTFNVSLAALAEPRYYGALIALILLAYLWNKLFYYFEKAEQLQDFEVMNLVVPAVTALFGGILFVDERNELAFLALMLSLLALYASRLKKRHWQFSAYSWLVLIMIFSMAAESVLRKYVLEIADPASLYLVRTLMVTIMLYLFYRPAKLNYSWKAWGNALVSSIIGGAAMILMFAGYQQIGIVLTTLVFVTSPMMVYFLDAAVLREKIATRNIVASGIILIAIVLAAVYG